MRFEEDKFLYNFSGKAKAGVRREYLERYHPLTDTFKNEIRIDIH